MFAEIFTETAKKQATNILMLNDWISPIKRENFHHPIRS